MSWRKSANLARKGLKPADAHNTMKSVVERLLKARPLTPGGAPADGQPLVSIPSGQQLEEARSLEDVEVGLPSERVRFSLTTTVFDYPSHCH